MRPGFRQQLAVVSILAAIGLLYACGPTADPHLEALPVDERIRLQVERELEGDPQVPADRIRVEVREGVVVLSGVVDTIDVARRALEIARRPEGVVEIVNRLRVLGSAGRSDSSLQQAAVGGGAGGLPRTSVRAT